MTQKKKVKKLKENVVKQNDNLSLYDDVDRLIETLKSEPDMLRSRIAGSTVYGRLKTEVIEAIKEKDKAAYKIISDYKKLIDKEYKRMKKMSPIYMSSLEFQKKISKENKPFDFETRHLEFTHKMLMAYCYHAMQRVIDDVVERAIHIPEKNTVMVDVNLIRESDLYAQMLGIQLEKMIKIYVKKERKLANKK